MNDMKPLGSVPLRACCLACAGSAAVYPQHGGQHFTVATLLISAYGVWLQIAQLRTLLDADDCCRPLDRETTRARYLSVCLPGFKRSPAWCSGSGQTRLPASLSGAAAVAAYSILRANVSAIYGLVAAGLHFLFPRLSVQHALDDRAGVRRTVLLASAPTC